MPLSPSLARQFYEDITGAPDQAAFIRALVNSTPPTFETDWLDFKQQPQPGDLRGKWIEALSGFANNQGGVIIWGVDARKDQTTNIDAANRVVPVRDPFAFKSRLVQLQRESTDPPLMNVEHEAYEDPAGSGTGFVVSYIPQGIHQPYRTVDGRDSQFFLRTGDSFFVMSRALLASMFHPRPKAIFRAKAALEYTYATVTNPAKLLCRMGLLNTGTASARDVSIRVTWEVPGTKKDMRAVGSTPWSNRDHEFCFTSGVVFHPGIEFGVCNGNWFLEDNIPLKVAAPDQVPIWHIVLKLYIQDQSPQTIRVGFNAMELTLKEKLEVEASPEE